MRLSGRDDKEAKNEERQKPRRKEPASRPATTKGKRCTRRNEDE
jgi:hypothetical protein